MAALSTHYHYAMTTADRGARVVRELLNGAYLSNRCFLFYRRRVFREKKITTFLTRARMRVCAEPTRKTLVVSRRTETADNVHQLLSRICGVRVWR